MIDTIAVLEAVRADEELAQTFRDINADRGLSWEEKIAEFRLFAAKAGVELEDDSVDWTIVLHSLGVEIAFRREDVVTEGRRLLASYLQHAIHVLFDTNDTWLLTQAGLLGVRSNLSNQAVRDILQADWEKLVIAFDEPGEEQDDDV